MSSLAGVDRVCMGIMKAGGKKKLQLNISSSRLMKRRVDGEALRKTDMKELRRTFDVRYLGVNGRNTKKKEETS